MAIAAATDRTRELQRTLYRAAKADPRRRFHALHDKVHPDPAAVVHQPSREERGRDADRQAGTSGSGRRQVRANRGAAGIDRQTIEQVERYGVARLLDELAADVRGGDHRFLPARRAFIAKPGSGERRPLSIPAGP
jgi:hypothetical protein